MKYKTCLVGHEQHKTTMVDSYLGPLFVYDAKSYELMGDYCTGDDDVSRTIAKTGGWARDETPTILEILHGDRNKLVVDLGCHIGYYTIMAAQFGHRVLAFDSNPENLAVLDKNVRLHHVADKVTAINMFIDQDSTFDLDEDVLLFKSDLEGNDAFAVEMLDNLFAAGKVDVAFIEISPVFNDTYPSMVDRLAGYGYRAFELDGQPFDGNFDFPQTDLVFERTT